jgi:predicted Na+-dependent transporter
VIIRPTRSDDPTGGRRLTRRLAVLLPICLAIGLAVGVPLAVIADDWRPALVVPLALAAVAGTIAAAIEDGRVDRDVNDGPRDGGG